MKCEACNTANPSDGISCKVCGTELKLFCLHCSTANPARFKFCGQCGQPLSGYTPSPSNHAQLLEAHLLKIQRYLPMELSRQILSRAGALDGERKQVTIMFCDISGFTALTEQFGDDHTFHFMDKIFRILVDKVNYYQGVVNEFRGDGILAFFGAPTALEDAPQRAIRSAIAIHKEIARFNQKKNLNGENGVSPVLLRIGINTGPVVVGVVGNDLRIQYTAMGDAINIASRIEAIAEAGSTYVSEQTFRLTEGFFRFEARGEHYFKGKLKPVKVYRVITSRGQRTRFDVNAERGLTPFAGRASALKRLLDGYQRAKDGAGQAFFVVSEAGMGKSRLLYEFRKQIAHESVIFLEGKCLSYSHHVPYHLLIDILQSVFNFKPADTSRQKAEKIRATLQLAAENQRSAIPNFLELLSLPAESAEHSGKVSPETKKDRILGILEKMVVKACEKQPLIIACEDLHWMDNNSGEALHRILQAVRHLPVLLVLTYRTEFKPPWPTESYHNQLELHRLSPEEHLRMVSGILGDKEPDHELSKLIEETTEGIPFFTEEFVRSLTDLEIIARKGDRYVLSRTMGTPAIPSTIHDVIMARVDSLSCDAKEVLQIGSAIEREFRFELLKSVVKGSDEKLLANLDELQHANLIYGYSDDSKLESSYIFKHALTREVVYDSILHSRRSQLHLMIGTSIEHLYDNRPEEFYAVLAHHFSEGEDYAKAAKYATLAGKQARKRSSYSDAIAFSKKSVACLEKLPQTEAIQKQIIDARTSTSNYCMGINHHYDAMQAVAPIVELAEDIRYREKLPQIYVSTGSYKVFAEEEFAAGIQELIRAKELALRYKDALAYWYAVFFLGSIYWLEADFDQSRAHFELTLQQSRSTGSISGICFSSCSMAAWPLGFGGKLGRAFKLSREALSMAVDSGDIFIQQSAYSSVGCCCYLKGLFAEAEKYLLIANELYQKAGNILWGALGQFWLGELYLVLGRLEVAIRYFQQSRETIEKRLVLPSWASVTETKILQCKSHLPRNEIDIDRDIDLACRAFVTNRIRINESIIANGISDILINSGERQYALAEKWLNTAISASRRYKISWRLASDFLLYSRLQARQGDRQKSRDLLATATRLFESFGADGWVERISPDRR